MQFDAQIGRLLGAYFEGKLGGEDFDAFEAWINADAAHAAALIEQATLSRLLGQHYKLTELERVQGPGFRVQERKSAIRNSQSAIGFALAAAIALAVTVWFVFTPEPRTLNSEPPATSVAPVAVLLGADDVVWSSEPQAIGENLSPGLMRAESGSMSVQMLGGASVTLVGPFEFEVESATSARLNYGLLQAEAPGNAAGFKVRTPNFEVVDLGTAFSVHAARDGSGQVAVMQGTVAVRRGEQVMRLVEGQQIGYIVGEGFSEPRRFVAAGTFGAALPPATDHATVAVSGLHLGKINAPGAPDARRIYTQTFAVDPARLLVGLECTTDGVHDAGQDAEFGIYAITLTTPIGAGQSVPLFACLNRDTIAGPGAPPTDGGWRRLGEYFDASSFASSTTNAAGDVPARITAGGVTYRLAASAGAPGKPDAWVIKVGVAEVIDLRPGCFARVSLLYSAVGFNPVGPGANNGAVILHYDDGTTERRAWDIADSNGAGLMPAPTVP